DDETAIVEIADQASDALLQRQDGLGELRVGERIAAGAADRIDASLDEGVARHRERQLVDDDETQRRPLDVDALPEARGPEQHGIAGLAKPLEQLAARAAPLHVDRPRRPVPLDPALGLAERAVA